MISMSLFVHCSFSRFTIRSLNIHEHWTSLFSSVWCRIPDATEISKYGLTRGLSIG